MPAEAAALGTDIRKQYSSAGTTAVPDEFLTELGS